MNEDRGSNPAGSDRWSQALSWHDALRKADKEELTNAIGRKWQDWYGDAENRKVFDKMSRLMANRGLYRERRRRSKVELESDSYDLSLPIKDWRRTEARKETQRQHRLVGGNWWWLSGGILVAALSAILTFWPRSLGFGGGTSQAIYRTDIGGLKDVHLLDGSTVVLGARTQLAVAFSGQRRSVRVIQGQAWFKVAHDTRWPFVVTAGGGTITDIGTAFLVTRDSDRVVVTVMEGAVEVSTRSVMRRSFTPDEGLVLGPALAPVRITRGEQVAFSDAGTLSALKQTDTHAAVAWTQGQLTFDNQPLRYVVETVNRYYQRRILVSPSAGSLRFSGIISDTAIGDWLRSLKIIFPVVIESHGAIVTIQMRSSNLGSAHLLPSKRH